MQTLAIISIVCFIPVFLAIFFSIILFLLSKRFEGYKSVTEYLSWIRNIFDFLTLRSLTAIIASVIFLLISLTSEELSVLSTIAIFIFLLALTFITVAVAAKLIIWIRRRLMKQEIFNFQINSREISEEDRATLKFKADIKIPWGYYLKIQANLPEKLGGNFRGVSDQSTGEVEATIPKIRRGRYVIGPVTFSYQDILGLSEIKFRLKNNFELTILPSIPYIQKYNFRLVNRKGDKEQVINSLITTEEYFSSKPYVRGNDIRRMHWKASAKKDTLILRQPESISVDFNKLSLFILNINTYSRNYTLVNKTVLSVHPFKQVNEDVLDTQVKVAAALIDFALRGRIPVEVYWYENRKIHLYTPKFGYPVAWKRKLADIKLQNFTPNFPQICDLLSESSASVLITSELRDKFVNGLIEAINVKGIIPEVIFCSLSYHMARSLDRKMKQSRGIFLRLLQKLLFTKTYLEQKTITNEVIDFFKSRQENYTIEEIEKIRSVEKNISEKYKFESIPFRFIHDEINVPEREVIINRLENEYI